MMKEFPPLHKNNMNNIIKYNQSSTGNSTQKNYESNNSNHIHSTKINPTFNSRNSNPMKSSFQIFKSETNLDKYQNEFHKKQLILDIDETLVFSDTHPIDQYDEQRVISINERKFKLFIRIRPGASNFIKEMSNYFELSIFTASHKEYADAILEIIDEEHLITKKFCNESCINYHQNLVKNLDLIKCDLKDVIIVDNNPKSYLMHPLNGLPIMSWFEDKEDNDLKLISKLLIFLSKVDDVRKYIPKFVANETICYENVDKLIFKSMIELKSEKMFTSRGSTVEQVTPEKKNKLTRKWKTKNDKFNYFYAPDEFINAFDTNSSPSRKVNQVRQFKINKSSFSNFNYNETNHKHHQVPNLIHSFNESELINKILIEKQKISQGTKKNDASIMTPIKKLSLIHHKSYSNLKESPLNIFKIFEGSFNEGLKEKEENNIKGSNDYLYFE